MLPEPAEYWTLHTRAGLNFPKTVGRPCEEILSSDGDITHSGYGHEARNMNIGTYCVHSPPPAHTVHTCQHVHKNIPPVHSMDRYGPACHVDRHSQCPAVSTCPPAQAIWRTVGGCRGCEDDRDTRGRLARTQEFDLTSTFCFSLGFSFLTLTTFWSSLDIYFLRVATIWGSLMFTLSY